MVDAARARRVPPLRVCLIIGQLGLGGAEKQIVLLADGLKQRGVDVTVVVLGGEGPRAAALQAAGVPVVYLGLRWPGRWRALPHILAVFGRLTSYLRRSRPDIVHAFLLLSYVIGAPAARLAGVPVFLAGRRSLDHFKHWRRLMIVAERVATQMTDLLVANAHAVADYVLATERVPPDKLAVIYNGLPQSAFAASEPAMLDTGHPVVLCVANLRNCKGHAHLLHAVALLCWRGLACTLALAGEGPERPALDQLTKHLGIDVRMLGARTDIDRLMARADVVVLPSLTEGMSNAVMEGMAAGRPVVATAVGGTPELLADGRGILVAPGDPAALANAIEDVLYDRERAHRMSQAAQEWSREHLHTDTMVRRHLDLYGTLLGQRCAA